MREILELSGVDQADRYSLNPMRSDQRAQTGIFSLSDEAKE